MITPTLKRMEMKTETENDPKMNDKNLSFIRTDVTTAGQNCEENSSHC